METARLLALPRPGLSGVLDWVLALREELGIPHSLGELGLKEEDAVALGPEAAQDPSAGGNPLPLDAESLTGLALRANEVAEVARVLILKTGTTDPRPSRPRGLR